MRLFTKKKKDGWFALSANAEGTSVAHIRAVGHGKPRVSLCEFRPGRLDDTGLKALSQKYGLKNRRCTFLLQPTEYQLIQVDAPDVPEGEARQAVRWVIKDRIDFPVDEATLDILNIPSSRFTYVAVARNDLIRGYMERCLERCGVALEVIDIAEAAQRNIAALLEEDGHGLAVLSFNQSGGLLTFTLGGELYYSRQIDITSLQLQTDDKEQLSRLFDRLALEVQRSLDNFERQFPKIGLNRLMLAPCAGRTAMRDFLLSYLGVKVDTFDLTDVLDMEGLASLDTLDAQAQVLGVLGAALREGAA